MRIVRTILGVCSLLLLLSTATVRAKDKLPLPGLTLKIGETWVFKIANAQPVEARLVETDTPLAADEIKVSLKASMGTMLTITNNSKTWYNYHAFITSAPNKKGQATSVCTLMGDGRMAFENWPNTINFMRIADFTATSEGEMGCR
jgi:hypothetical protein